MTLDQTPAIRTPMRNHTPTREAVSRVWARNWEFWLAVGLAAFLRMWHIELTQFLQDQMDLMLLARSAIVHGALPITSNHSSIGTYHPPMSIYFLLPFSAFTSNPLPAVISIALVNVLAVALAYIFALRYFGRLTAGVAAQLFATSDTLINYSRFLWQPSYIAFVTLLMVMALYRGCVRGKPNALVLGALLLLVDVLIHFANLLLAPILLLALLAAPTRPGRRAWLVGGGAALVMLTPSILFEAFVSHGSDLRVYLHSSNGARLDLQVVSSLIGLLDGPGGFGGQTHAIYDVYGRYYPALNVAAVLLFVAGILTLTVQLALPLIRGWRVRSGAAMPAERRLISQAFALWRDVAADPEWRKRALLWVWVAAPVTALLRHTEPVTVHYLLLLAPGVFIVQGFGMCVILAGLRALMLPGTSVTRHVPSSVVSRGGATLVVLLVGLLVAGQAVRWALYPASLANGEFVAYDGYGFPLAEVQAADARLSALQREQHASAAYIVTPEHGRYGEPYDYIFANERPNRTTFDLHCLVLPAPLDGPVLIATTQPGTAPAHLLANLPSAAHVADIPMLGGAPFAVYRVQGATPALAGEHTTPPVTFSDRAGHGLRLQGAALVQSNLVRLRWTVLDRSDSSTQPRYRVSLLMGSTQSGFPGADAHTDCVPTRLHAGQTVIMWIALPQDIGGLPTDVPVSVRVQRNTVGLDMPAIGPFRFLTGRPGDSPLVTLSQSNDPSGTPATAPYMLPLARSAQGDSGLSSGAKHSRHTSVFSRKE